MKLSCLFLLGCLFSVQIKAQITLRLNSLPAKYTPQLDTLFVAGDFNSWNPRDTAYRFKKNAQGQLEAKINSMQTTLLYKITRGSWPTVEVAANGSDIPNRSSDNVPNSLITIDVVDWSDTKNTHTSQPRVQILTSQLWLKSLKRYRRIWVSLPTEYQANPTKYYPVMYFHDGQNVFDAATSFTGEWKVDEAMALLEAQPGWEPVIAVGVDNGGGERINELTPYRHPTYGGGKGELYAQAIVEDVKPLIDTLFRTKKDVANTAVGGSSLGGIETLFMGYRYPNIFSKCLIFSPSLWFSDSLRQYCVAQPQPVTSKLYWMCGTSEGDPDMVPDMDTCYADLLAAGMPANQMKKLVVTGGTHSESSWSQQVKAGISWLFTPTTTAVKKNESQRQSPFLIRQSEGQIHLQTNPESLKQSISYQLVDLSGRLLSIGKIGKTETEIPGPTGPKILLISTDSAVYRLLIR